MSSKKITSDIVILGHIAKDINVIDGISKVEAGGSVYYGGIAGSHMGLKIIVLTRLNKEDFFLLEDFKKFGIKYYASPSDETSGLKNIYSSKNLEERVCKPLGFAGLFTKEEIPEINTQFFILGPIIAGEIDEYLVDYLANLFPGKLCMDIQGFVRIRDKKKDSVYFQDLSQEIKVKILKNVTILKVDKAEAKVLTGNGNIEKAAKELVELGPKEILLTHEKGISLYTDNNSYFFPWKYKVIRGRTGRGDTAFISYVGSRINKTPEESLKFAAALTSLKLESPGPFILPLFQVDDLIKNEY